ncbi:MAG: hypothetical protein ABI599_16230 [Flavobacteriales bacterium]
MKTFIAFFSLLLLAACNGPVGPKDTAPATNSTDEQWARLEGLAGRWSNALDTGAMHMYEEWTQPDSTHWTGLGFVMAGSDTVSIEDLRMVRNGTVITYGARLSTQNNGEWVDFELQASGADTLLFTNPAHDFPKEIRYTKEGGGWRVLVEGSDPGKGDPFELLYMPRPASTSL